MRHGSRIAIIIFAALAVGIPEAHADQNASKIWFLSLDAPTRSEIQTDLVLAGDYSALIDGNFGPQTFASLQAYQRSIDDPTTGVLSSKELSALRAEANSVSAAFGFRKEEDPEAGLEISIPTKLLSYQSASGTGTVHRSPDGDLQLQTERISFSDPEAFSALFAERSAPTPSTVVSYSRLEQSAFTVTGTTNGRYFYERFYANNSGAAGFTLTWTKEVNDRGTILATYLASFSKPLDHGTIELGLSPDPQPPPGASSIPVPPAAPRQTEVQLQAQGGTFLVPVLINNTLPLQFMVDSGASDVSIPADVVLTLVRTGTVTQSDFTGSQTYTTADGRSLPSQTFRIRSLRVGDKVAKNVDALVAPVEGELLLGESFLSRFSSWSIDNSRHVLVLGSLREQGVGDGSNGGTAYAPTQPPPPKLSAAAPERSAESPATVRLALYGGLDFYGNDIFKGRVADAVHCAAACLGERQCQAFTFNANPHIHSGPNCFLKGSVNHLEAYSTAVGGLFLQQGQEAPQYKFDAIDPTTDLMVNRDIPGGDLSNYPYAPAKTLDNCRMACDDNQQCAAFSYVTSLHQCWLKGSAGKTRSARGIVSGIKHQVSIGAQDVVNVPR